MTKSFLRALLLSALLLTGNSAIADGTPSTGTINYEGQASDNLSLANKRTETRYREEMRDTTCTRQVPYTERVCGYETRYRQECRYEPPRNVCRTVTRYRQECRMEPGRRVCRQEPPRRQCRTRPDGTQICRDIPGRQVCTNEPSRRVCRQVPYNERVCHTEPGRNVCHQVPYQEYVCRDVTRYRTETYPCRRMVQIPYDFVVQLLAEIEVDFTDRNTSISKAALDFAFNDAGEVTLAVRDGSQAESLILGTQQITRNDSDDRLDVKANYDITFLNKAAALAPVTEDAADFALTRKSVAFTIAKADALSDLGLHLKITQKTVFGNDREKLDRALSKDQYQVQDLGTHIRVTVDLAQFDVELKKDKEHTVAVTTDLRFKERILNATRPTLSKTTTSTINTK